MDIELIKKINSKLKELGHKFMYTFDNNKIKIILFIGKNNELL